MLPMRLAAVLLLFGALHAACGGSDSTVTDKAATAASAPRVSAKQTTDRLVGSWVIEMRDEDASNPVGSFNPRLYEPPVLEFLADGTMVIHMKDKRTGRSVTDLVFMCTYPSTGKVKLVRESST